MNTVLSIACDPRVDGTACSLYFELLKKIDRFGYCQLHSEMELNHILPQMDFRHLNTLKDAGYIDLYVSKGIFNIQFKFI